MQKAALQQLSDLAANCGFAKVGNSRFCNFAFSPPPRSSSAPQNGKLSAARRRSFLWGGPRSRAFSRKLELFFAFFAKLCKVFLRNSQIAFGNAREPLRGGQQQLLQRRSSSCSSGFPRKIQVLLSLIIKTELFRTLSTSGLLRSSGVWTAPRISADAECSCPLGHFFFTSAPFLNIFEYF